VSGKGLDKEILESLKEALGDRFTHVLQVFLEETPRALQEMLDLCEAGDFEHVRILVHSLKSTSASVGAMVVSELSSDLEEKLKTGDNSTTAADLANIKAAFDQVAPLFREYL